LKSSKATCPCSTAFLILAWCSGKSLCAGGPKSARKHSRLLAGEGHTRAHRNHQSGQSHTRRRRRGTHPGCSRPERPRCSPYKTENDVSPRAIGQPCMEKQRKYEYTHQCFQDQLPCSSISTQVPKRSSPLVILVPAFLQTVSLQPARLLGEISALKRQFTGRGDAEVKKTRTKPILRHREEMEKTMVERLIRVRKDEKVRPRRRKSWEVSCWPKNWEMLIAARGCKGEMKCAKLRNESRRKEDKSKNRLPTRE
jgi:hypothetical protein